MSDSTSTLRLATPRGYTLRKDLTALLESFDEKVKEFQSLTGDKLEAVSTEYIELQEKSEKLKRQLEEDERIARLDLDLKIKADKVEAFQTIASELNYAVITQEEVKRLRNELKAAQTDVENRIEEAVKKIEKSSAIATNAKINKIESDAAVASAQLKAENDTLREKVSWLQTQLSETREMLSTANENSVRIAEAGSKSISISPPDSKK